MVLHFSHILIKLTMFQAQELTGSINKKACIVDGVQDRCEIHPTVNSFTG